jgi:hypothetical protein
MALSIESIVQPYSVNLEGQVEDQIFTGLWKYAIDEMEGLEDGNEPAAFCYKV